MKKLTAKEEEIMRLLWAHGDMFIQELVSHYPEPKPHHNTLATQLGFLEDKGYISREKFVNAYRYHALVSEQDFGDLVIDHVVDKYYSNSYSSVVSRFVQDEKMELDELKALIAQIESQRK